MRMSVEQRQARRAVALRLRLSGLTWRATADRAGYASASAALADIRRALRRAGLHPNEEKP